MNRLYLISLCLVAVSLACSMQVSTPIPTAEPTATRLITMTATRFPVTATRQAWTASVLLPTVNVRDEPNGNSTDDYLTAGQGVSILQCVGNWCEIANPHGWVWRGCLSDNPDHLGCQAK